MGQNPSKFQASTGVKITTGLAVKTLYYEGLHLDF